LQVEAESSIAIQLNEYLPAVGRPDGELMASLEPSTCNGSCVFSRSRAACRNRSRARDSVDITVPIGTPVTSAISSSFLSPPDNEFEINRS